MTQAADRAMSRAADRAFATLARRLGCTDAQAWVVVVVVMAATVLAAIGLPPTFRDGPAGVAGALVPPPGTNTVPVAPPGDASGSPAAVGPTPVPLVPAPPAPAVLPGRAVGSDPATDAPALFPRLLDPLDGTAQLFVGLTTAGRPAALAAVADDTIAVGLDTGATPVIRRFAPDGSVVHDHAIGGGAATSRAVTALADDAAGRRLVAVLTNPAEVVAVDHASGEVHPLASIPDLAPCLPVVAAPPCQPGVVDQPPAPSAAAVAPNGDVYIADPAQSTIFRLAAGGSTVEAWHQAQDYLPPGGPGGLAVERSGSVVFSARSVIDLADPANQATAGSGLPSGGVYRLEVGGDGRPGARSRLTAVDPALGPGAVAVGPSGRLYVALRDAHQVLVLDPDGNPLRVLGAPGAGELPSPAALSFRHGTLLLASGPPDPGRWAVLAVGVGEEWS